jgi:predicted PurR-regulated permease PerM
LPSDAGKQQSVRADNSRLQMKQGEDQDKKLSPFGMAFFAACFLVLGYLLYRVFNPFFSTLIWACALTVVFHPLFRVMLRISGERRTIASLTTCVLILILIVLPVTFLGILLSQQSVAFYQNLQANMEGTANATAERLREFESQPIVQWFLRQANRLSASGPMDLQGLAQQALSAIARFVVSRGPSLLAGVGEMIYGLLLIFITMFFLFRDGPAVMEVIKASNPLPEAYRSEIIQKFQDVSFATFYGSLLTAMVQGGAAALLFWSLDIKPALLWGGITAFVSLVPLVGTFLVWIPMSAYLILTGATTRGLILLAVGGLVVSSIDNVLKPVIIQGHTDMHSLLVFLSVLGGMQAFGFLGILLGPLLVAIFLSFLHLYQEQHRQSSKPEAG